MDDLPDGPISCCIGSKFACENLAEGSRTSIDFAAVYTDSPGDHSNGRPGANSSVDRNRTECWSTTVDRGANEGKVL